LVIESGEGKVSVTGSLKTVCVEAQPANKVTQANTPINCFMISPVQNAARRRMSCPLQRRTVKRGKDC